MAEQFKNLNPLVGWINDLISLFSNETIKVPREFHDQVSKLQRLLESDVSGLVNTLLDFAVDCALVDYKIETSNSNLTTLLNDWMKTINSDLRGKVEVGIRGLAKQYFIERWKNSSLCLMRVLFEETTLNNSKFYLPQKMWFVDGGKVYIEEDGETAQIGEENYELKVGKSKSDRISLPKNSNEFIFVQKPYSKWGAYYPVPFLIQRGIYRNLEFLSLLSRKGEMVVGKALEYLFVMKKGLERLFVEKGISYSKEELEDFRPDEIVTSLEEVPALIEAHYLNS